MPWLWSTTVNWNFYFCRREWPLTRKQAPNERQLLEKMAQMILKKTQWL